MKALNNFQQLEAETQEEFPITPQMEADLMRSIRMIDMFGEAVNLYLPILLETVSVWLGGNAKHLEDFHTRDYQNLPGAGDWRTDDE